VKQSLWRHWKLRKYARFREKKSHTLVYCALRCVQLMPGPNEYKTVQARILAYAQEIGWSFVPPEEAERRCGFDPYGDLGFGAILE
jgi:hypothetical protein